MFMQRYQQWLWQKAVPLLAVVSTLSLGGCSQSADNTKTVPPPVKQAATTTDKQAATTTDKQAATTTDKQATTTSQPGDAVDLKTAILGTWVSPEGTTILKDFRGAALEFKADGSLRGETDGAYSLENKDDPKKTTLLPLQQKVSYTGQYTLTGNTLTIRWEPLGDELFLDSLYRPSAGQWVIEVVTPTQLVLKQLNSPEDSIQKTWLLSTWRRPSNKS
jgi:uncharacterized lipoprotein NlpE involved in copper resistance